MDRRGYAGRHRIVDHREPTREAVAGIAARLTGEAGGESILHTAVTNAARDQARLQAVAGRHVHVVYFDTVLAAVDTLDDRSLGRPHPAWVELARRRVRSALPPALGLRSWLEVLQGRVGLGGVPPRRDRGCRLAHRVARVLGAPAAALVLHDAWLGDEEATGPVPGA